MTDAPKTLGEKLSPKPKSQSYKKLSVEPARPHKRPILTFLRLPILISVAAVPIYWFVTHPETDIRLVAAMAAVLFGVWVIVEVTHKTTVTRVSAHKVRSRDKTPTHSLLENDRQGFMKNLRLDAKTVIFDGSNIYHFGHDKGLDAQPLGLLAYQLRNEGYRIVCFFDANIYYTISEHGAFGSNQRHSLTMLQDAFGLAPNEIYIVPSGVQADQYILNALKHLPKSFAVTNDQFRDYAKQFPDVMKGQWRKGVKISNGQLKLLQHKLKQPIHVG
jgi:hypothetical protein